MHVQPFVRHVHSGSVLAFYGLGLTLVMKSEEDTCDCIQLSCKFLGTWAFITVSIAFACGVQLLILAGILVLTFFPTTILRLKHALGFVLSYVAVLVTYTTHSLLACALPLASRTPAQPLLATAVAFIVPLGSHSFYLGFCELKQSNHRLCNLGTCKPDKTTLQWHLRSDSADVL